MSATARWTPALAAGACMLFAACAPGPGAGRASRSTLVVGIDVSGSFREHHENSIQFAANYLYAHLNGLGGLKQPTAVFVGAVGGERPSETKAFQPIHTFSGLSVEEIADYLRSEYPSRDGFTDFNPFFERVASLVQRQGLVLSPIEVVLFTDGIPDTPAESGDTLGPYKRIDLGKLEYLSKSVTLRVLYPRPTVAVNWERRVPRQRVRMWTVADEVMTTWTRQRLDSIPPEGQDALWKWIGDNVDHRVRSVGVL